MTQSSIIINLSSQKYGKELTDFIMATPLKNVILLISDPFVLEVFHPFLFSWARLLLESKCKGHLRLLYPVSFLSVRLGRWLKMCFKEAHWLPFFINKWLTPSYLPQRLKLKVSQFPASNIKRVQWVEWRVTGWTGSDVWLDKTGKTCALLNSVSKEIYLKMMTRNIYAINSIM